jgi:hypothetical protein
MSRTLRLIPRLSAPKDRLLPAADEEKHIPDDKRRAAGYDEVG